MTSARLPSRGTVGLRGSVPLPRGVVPSVTVIVLLCNRVIGTRMKRYADSNRGADNQFPLANLAIAINSRVLEYGVSISRDEDPSSSLRDILNILRCDYVRVVRYRPGRHLHSPEIVTGVASDKTRWLRPPNSHELTNPVLPAVPEFVNGGSIWTMQDLRFDDRPEEDSPWHRLSIRYGFHDLWTIVLESSPSHVDLIEFFVGETLSTRGRSFAYVLTLAANALSDIWSRRPSGYVARHLDRTRTSEIARIPLLSYENPLGLTKSEFRICDKFVKGHSIKRIALSLQVSPHTVRSHLRNIYLKTGTNSQRALIVLLLENKAASEEVRLRV